MLAAGAARSKELSELTEGSIEPPFALAHSLPIVLQSTKASVRPSEAEKGRGGIARGGEGGGEPRQTSVLLLSELLRKHDVSSRRGGGGVVLDVALQSAAASTIGMVHAYAHKRTYARAMFSSVIERTRTNVVSRHTRVAGG